MQACYPAESLDHGCHAVMADTRRTCVTMQGIGYPVSAAGQGGKAGPQASSSSNRSSTLVGDLANAEFRATRKKSKVILPEHNCESEHNVFCHVCSKFKVSSLRKVIDDDIRETYKDIFGFDMDGSGIESGAPNIICNCCRKMFIRWKKEKNKHDIRFSAPTIWKRPSSADDCFYCCNKIQGYNSKTKSKIVYITVSSVVAPVLATIEDSSTSNASHVHPETIADVMEVDEIMDMEVESASEMSDETDSDMDDRRSSKITKLISQVVLNDLVRNLGLPKDGSEFLASFLKERNMLKSKTKVSFYRNREMKFR